MSNYIAVQWVHNDPREAGEPVILYSELDEHRWETRKVWVWADGSVGWADADHEVETFLGEVPMGSIDEIESRDFHAREISAEEFEAVWLRRLHSPVHQDPSLS